MQSTKIYQTITAAHHNHQKQFAVLIDPDKVTPKNIHRLVTLATKAKVDYFLIGGSLMVNNTIDHCIEAIKECCDIPTVLFPGHSVQLSFKADGILFLSLISGRNPDLLIGQHVIAAPLLHKSQLEVLPTGYMLIDGGIPTSVTYMSNTTPIPSHKNDIAVCTAIAGEMLGLKVIYMDAGSGAKESIPLEMIQAVSQSIKVPLIIGGGIRTALQAYNAVDAGADIIVVGNAIEKNPSILVEISEVIHSYGTSEVQNPVS